MKKNLFLSIIGLLLFSTATIAQIRTIEHPEYESCNTGSLEICKVEMKDSETVLYCDGFGRPDSWIYLTSKSYLKGKSGKIYKFIRSEGFEMDKEIYMPASGTISFKLYMESLDKNETSFDFMEGENSDQFRILGIKTYKTKSTAPIHCIIKGEVIDRPQSSRLILIKAGGDQRISAKYISIKNGKFEYELNCQDLEAYQLIFFDENQNGQWRPITFFAESGIVSFKLFPMDRFFDNEIEGGKLNGEYAKHLANRDSLFQFSARRNQENSLKSNNKYYSEVAMNLRKQSQATKDQHTLDSLHILVNKLYDSGEIYTPEAQNLEKQSLEMSLKCKDWQLKYIQENNSLVGYYLLIYRMEVALGHFKEDIPECIELYHSIYAKKYPKHPFTEQMKNKVESFSSIKVGGSYIDFVAPDFTGEPVRLSEQIKGKVALIDLWASWCGPCRRSAKSMISVYEAYKDKGFTIVGVARESELTYGINAAQKDKYPWLNLIELKDKGKIWEKYGVGNGGGGTFLVDKNGIILAMSPTDEEVKTILDKLLK